MVWYTARALQTLVKETASTIPSKVVPNRWMMWVEKLQLTNLATGAAHFLCFQFLCFIKLMRLSVTKDDSFCNYPEKSLMMCIFPPTHTVTSLSFTNVRNKAIIASSLYLSYLVEHIKLDQVDVINPWQCWWLILVSHVPLYEAWWLAFGSCIRKFYFPLVYQLQNASFTVILGNQSWYISAIMKASLLCWENTIAYILF